MIRGNKGYSLHAFFRFFLSNSIARRTYKIPYSFGHSEFNRVNLLDLSLPRPFIFWIKLS